MAWSRCRMSVAAASTKSAECVTTTTATRFVAAEARYVPSHSVAGRSGCRGAG